ncbi:E3 ubiquitin-protein ligase Topors-like [Zootermopsis nevadensis]|uniref:Uncharacterized protein n=1 Tax=Zootermopsis nevadensis TaxID=136037 RepID=A0A067RH22_ZOONE|nr:E3 ubiquitin-protein ligase Topors-like [Zootermopsis nevadensis]KDR19617.1 hypothetical protein L798_06493 [Zootermopsis nevadensis]
MSEEVLRCFRIISRRRHLPTSSDHAEDQPSQSNEGYNSSDDCVIVGYVKPRHERTPEVITLLSSDPEVTKPGKLQRLLQKIYFLRNQDHSKIDSDSLVRSRDVKNSKRQQTALLSSTCNTSSISSKHTYISRSLRGGRKRYRRRH